MDGVEKLSPDALAQSYLRRANVDGTGALVVYAFRGEDGREVVHMASNRDDKTTQAFLAWLSKVDDRIVETTARALCRADNLSWDALAASEQHNYAQTARVALDAARTAQPRTLNIIKAT